eukprot:SAG31_NODE_11188_length_1056_cov_1.666667_1_plen_287_part_10
MRPLVFELLTAVVRSEPRRALFAALRVGAGPIFKLPRPALERAASWLWGNPSDRTSMLGSARAGQLLGLLTLAVPCNSRIDANMRLEVRTAGPSSSNTESVASECVDSLPPDLPWPIPVPLVQARADSRDFKWLLDGSPLLQGWGTPYQRMLVEAAASNSSFVHALQQNFGFSAVILNPPGTSGWGGSSIATFRDAVAAFARAGMGVVLYSSIVHAGEDPIWTSGNLSRQHPEWLQRHQDGTPWLLETKAALSPSSDLAVEFTLNRTLKLLADFPEASGIMLDNNEL